MARNLTTNVVAASPRCSKCGSRKEQRGCWNCGGEGYDGHDCGDDACCCAAPVDNVVCSICDGEEWFYVCGTCFPEPE